MLLLTRPLLAIAAIAPVASIAAALAVFAAVAIAVAICRQAAGQLCICRPCDADDAELLVTLQQRGPRHTPGLQLARVVHLDHVDCREHTKTQLLLLVMYASTHDCVLDRLDRSD